ncbi:MAG TPA: prolipoprotein diacylglyceryl transferase [Chthoniobacterales bacterium]
MSVFVLLAFYVHDLSPFLIQFNDSFGLRWYGLAYVAGFIAGYYLYRWFSRKGYADLPEKEVGDFITWWVVLGTLLGGRLGYVLFYRFGEFLADPWMILRVWEGGMSAHGGILGLLIATMIYARRHRIRWFNLADNLAVTAPIGLFFGRCANFINGELYGRATTMPWAMQFPKEALDRPELQREILLRVSQEELNRMGAWDLERAVRESEAVRRAAAEVLTPRHPSQLYEALLEGALLFALLFFLRTRCRLPNGILTGTFFIAYALLRSFCELFRMPDAELTGILTRGQLLSIFLILIGAGCLWVAWRQQRYPLRQSLIDSSRAAEKKTSVSGSRTAR